MIWLSNLAFGFFFSFIGSIPPGTINLSVIQLGLRKHLGAAFRMALAAALIEYVYAAIAIKFQIFITSSPAIKENFQLITAVVLLALGGVNLLALRRKKSATTKTPVMASSGFRKGVLLSLGNPLAMPFWIAVTAYLQSNSWVSFEVVPIWSYVLGISLGTLAVLSLLGLISYKTGKFIEPDNKLIKIIPGIVLVTLGLYSLIMLYI